MQKHRCGVCKGVLAQIKPVPRGRAAGKAENEYQIFVRENMKKIREENPGSPQKDIMGLVGKRYQEYKASKMAKAPGERWMRRKIYLMMGRWRSFRGRLIFWI